ALALRERNLARLPVRYRGKRLGDLPIEEAYIYPKTGPMTRDEVLSTVIALMNRRGRIQPSTVTFSDGTAKEAIPTGIQLHPIGGLQIVLLEPGTGQSQAVETDEVVNIE